MVQTDMPRVSCACACHAVMNLLVSAAEFSCKLHVCCAPTSRIMGPSCVFCLPHTNRTLRQLGSVKYDLGVRDGVVQHQVHIQSGYIDPPCLLLHADTPAMCAALQ